MRVTKLFNCKKTFGFFLIGLTLLLSNCKGDDPVGEEIDRLCDLRILGGGNPPLAEGLASGGVFSSEPNTYKGMHIYKIQWFYHMEPVSAIATPEAERKMFKDRKWHHVLIQACRHNNYVIIDVNSLTYDLPIPSNIDELVIPETPETPSDGSFSVN